MFVSWVCIYSPRQRCGATTQAIPGGLGDMGDDKAETVVMGYAGSSQG